MKKAILFSGGYDSTARPKNMFFSPVDKLKYPDIKQEYRLEKIKGTF